MFLQCCFDLAQLDTDAAHFYLVIGATEKLEAAVRQVAAEISRTIHACAGRV